LGGRIGRRRVRRNHLWSRIDGAESPWNSKHNSVCPQKSKTL